MKRFFALLLSVLLLAALAVPAFAAGETAPPYADSAWFTYGDYRIHYRVLEADSPKGQILFLHGFAQSTYSWENLAAILRENGYTCVLADLPDFGYSSRETADTEMRPREEIVHALMEALSAEPWYLAGHSMGGYIALSVAQTYPESVKNLLLFCTAGNDGKPDALRPLTSSKAVAETLGPVMELFARSRLLVRLLLLFALHDPAYALTYPAERIIAPLKIKGTGAGAIYNFSMLQKTDYEKVAAMPPILFVNGDADLVIPDAQRVNLRAHLPEGSMDYVVKGGGHMLIENRAAEAAAVALNFLAANP